MTFALRYCFLRGLAAQVLNVSPFKLTQYSSHWRRAVGGRDKSAVTNEELFPLLSTMMMRSTIGKSRHEKTCLYGSATRHDSNRPAQLQKLARILHISFSNYRYCTVWAAKTKGADQKHVRIWHKTGFLITKRPGKTQTGLLIVRRYNPLMLRTFKTKKKKKRKRKEKNERS